MAGEMMVAEAEVAKDRAEVNVHRVGAGGGWVGGSSRGPRPSPARSALSRWDRRSPTTISPRPAQRQGYTCGHTSWILRIDHAERPPEPALPPGLVSRDDVAGRDDREVSRVGEDAFGEWETREPTSFEDWRALHPARPGFEPMTRRGARGHRRHRGGRVPDPQRAGRRMGSAARDEAAYRRRGIARAILQQAGGLLAPGKHALELSTDSRTDALGLYEKMGMRLRRSFTNLRTSSRSSAMAVAVAEGFEPSGEFPPHTLSRRVPSAARAGHRDESSEAAFHLSTPPRSHRSSRSRTS